MSAAYVEKMSCLSGFKGFDEDFFWNPAWELEDGPSPLTAPLLPIPFTAQDLSALLVGTISCFIRDQFGEIGHLNESKLESCLGKKGREAKKALREAYALAADAMAVVGTPETLDASTDEGRRKWREAMVRALLERAEDAESQAAPAVERQGEARTPAELAPESKATPKHTKHDDIQIEIDDVKAWLEKQETRATPNTVMAELKKPDFDTTK